MIVFLWDISVNLLVDRFVLGCEKCYPFSKHSNYPYLFLLHINPEQRLCALAVYISQLLQSYKVKKQCVCSCLEVFQQSGASVKIPFWLASNAAETAGRANTATHLQNTQRYRAADWLTHRQSTGAGATYEMVFISFFSASGRARFSTLRKSDVLALIRVWM